MTVLLRLRVVIAIAIGGILIGGCSSDNDADVDPSAASPSTATTGPSTSPTASASPAAAECQVAGYVPSTGITVSKIRPVVVYAHRITLAPGSAVGSKALELGLAEPLRLRVHPADPGTTPLEEN